MSQGPLPLCTIKGVFIFVSILAFEPKNTEPHLQPFIFILWLGFAKSLSFPDWTQTWHSLVSVGTGTALGLHALQISFKQQVDSRLYTESREKGMCYDLERTVFPEPHMFRDEALQRRLEHGDPVLMSSWLSVRLGGGLDQKLVIGDHLTMWYRSLWNWFIGGV